MLDRCITARWRGARGSLHPFCVRAAALGLLLLCGPPIGAQPSSLESSVDTLAGGGPVGDGGPAHLARFNLPGGVTVSPEGDLIIVDFGNHRVRRVDHRTGVIETLAGTGEAGYNGDGIPASQAQLARPEYAVYGPAGDLFIADSYNNRVRRIDPRTGLISTVAGTGERGGSGDGGPAVQAELHFPEGIAVDAAGNLFISDTVNRRIRRVDARTGIISAYAGIGGVGGVGLNAEGTPAPEARFLRLARIAVDTHGNIFIADSPSHCILVIDAATRTVRTFAGSGRQGYGGDGGPATQARLSFPEGVVVAPNGDVYLADVGNHRVRKVEARTGIIRTVAGTGEKGFSGDGGPAVQARLWSPGRVWVDEAGDLFIADILNARIRRVAAVTGLIDTVAGRGDWGDGGPAREALLSVPGDVVFAAGKVYIADYGTRRIRCVDMASGVITTVAGGGTRSGDGIPAVEADLLLPEGIAVDGTKALYIADNVSSRVWKVDLATGILHAFAGTGEPGDTGDGGPAREARLRLPGAVAVGEDGTVYIADFGNRRVRAVEPGTGIIRTLHAAASGGGADPLALGITSLEARSEGLYHLVHESDEVRLFDPDNPRGPLDPLDPLKTAQPGLRISGLPPAPSGDSQVIDMAVRQPYVYLADALAHRILRLDLRSAETAVVAGDGIQGFKGDGGPAAQASFFQPGGVAVSGDGRELYIADSKNHRVRRVRFPQPEVEPGREGLSGHGITRFQLPNGLALAVAVRPELRLAAVNLTVDLGSIDDPQSQSGMAHLLEHVTLQGSATLGTLDAAAEAAALTELDRAVRALERERLKPEPEPGALIGLERWFEQAQKAAQRTSEPGEILGGRLEARGAIGLNATTTADATQFFTWIPVEDLEYWVSLEADRLRQPVFRRFYSERNVVLREIAGLTGGKPTPQERFLEELFPGAPEAQPRAGDPDEIRAIDRPIALAHFNRFYRPENLAIAVVGDVDPQQVYRLCLRYFGDWEPEGPAEPPPSRQSRPAPPAAPRVRTFNRTRSPLVFLAFPRADGPREAAALEVLAELVNSRDLSPLKLRMEQEQPLAWSVGAAPSYPSEKQTSIFLVHVYGNPGVRHETLVQEVSALLKALGQAPDVDVEGAILQAEMRLSAQLDDPPALAALLGLHEAIHDDAEVPFARLDELRRLTPEDVRGVARRMFSVQPVAAAAIAGPGGH